MGKRCQDTKFPSCCARLMCVYFFSRGPYCWLPFGVCSAVIVLSSWDSAFPQTIVFTHSRSHLETKRVFSAANLLKRGVKRKRNLIGLGLAKVSILLCLVRFLKDWMLRNIKIVRTLIP